MAIKDPVKRREYDRELKRKKRAEEKLGRIVRPTPARGRRRTTGAPSGAAEVPSHFPDLGFDPVTWEAEKCKIGWKLVHKSQAALAALESANMTAKETMDFLTLGCKLIETSLAGIKSELAALEGLDWEALLNDPEAMEHVIALLPYVRNSAQEEPGHDSSPGVS